MYDKQARFKVQKRLNIFHERFIQMFALPSS